MNLVLCYTVLFLSLSTSALSESPRPQFAHDHSAALLQNPLQFTQEIQEASWWSMEAIKVSDVLSRHEINIFSGLTRKVSEVDKRLSNGSLNTTVLAPLNSEMTSLPHKPWQDPEDYNEFGANAYEGNQGKDRAEKNLAKFVMGHIIPMSPWPVGEKVESLGGQALWFDKQDDKMTIQPLGIAVKEVADRVSNGQVWVLQGVIPTK